MQQLDGHKRMLKNVVGLGRSHQPNQFHFYASNSLTHFKYASIRSHVLIAVGVYLRERETKNHQPAISFFRLVLCNTSCCRDRCSVGGNPDPTARNSAFEARYSQQLQQVGAAAEMLTIYAGLQSLQLSCFFLRLS